eukprot:gene13744-4020_t
MSHWAARAPQRGPHYGVGSLGQRGAVQTRKGADVDVSWTTLRR